MAGKVAVGLVASAGKVAVGLAVSAGKVAVGLAPSAGKVAVGLAVGLAASVWGKIADFGLQESVSYISNKIRSSNQLEDRYKWLEQALQRLLAMKKDKEKEVQQHKHKDTTAAYELWRNGVSKIAAETDTLRNEYEGRRIPSIRIWERSSLSEKIKGMLDEIDQLERRYPTDFLVGKVPEPVLKESHVPQITGYGTLQDCLEGIVDFLKDSNIKAVGVRGTKGVGKTTVLRNLNNNDEVAKLFGMVIFIRGESAQTIDKLQRAIAERLMVDKEAMEDPGELARRIHIELGNKKYLLILDDIVNPIDLNELGIPDNNNGSKVVMATQFPHVFKSNKVRLIPVEKLSPDEAWMMFRNIIGQGIDLPDVQPIARIVCNRCACLPLLINMIASSFQLKKSASSWRAGLEYLWPDLEYQGAQELYSFLKSCYDELKDENKQKCFLYTSLYPADSKVYSDYLVECWAANGFLGDVNDTRRYQNARDRGNDILERLIQVSLLEKGERMKYVRMNDCIKQLALHISSRLETWQSARRVSMIDQRLRALPTNQDCNLLFTLLLQKNPELVTIPPAFFENMRNLLLLDLYGTGIGQLPHSISALTSLKGIYLNGCVLLMMLPSEIRSLQHLEVLDIRGSGVTSIPSHLKYLTNLRCLRISYGTNHCRDENVEANRDVISELHKLEELVIEVICYTQWSNDAKHVIQQVASLTNLSILVCSFPSSSILQEFLETSRSWRNDGQFNSFRFFVGCESSKCHQIIDSFKYRINNYLKYCNGEKNYDLIISEILLQTDVCELVCHRDIKSLSSWVEAATLNRIRGIVIERCNKLSTVVAGDMDDNNMNVNGENHCILENLEHLYLDNLLILEWAFRGPLSLSNLKTLTLKNCPMLKGIFFFREAIQDFPQLQKLTVQDCSEIEELFNVNGRDVLQQLELLELKELPKLRDICQYGILKWSSLKSIKIHRCPTLETLPFGIDDATKLRSIEGEQQWWNSLVWKNRDEERFQSKFVASNN